jgi:RNA polymerase sigma-70 factor (ECF subfamily)
MSADPLDALLEKLSGGDDAAAQEVFRTYEPYLRLVVRRMLPDQLRSKFDSVDVVQSVWADVLQGFRTSGWRFTNAAQLKAFLVRVTRNRFIDRYRQHRIALERQRSLGPTDLAEVAMSTDERPSEVAEADELWQQMLTLCPPAHRQLLELKRQGCSLAEIAEQTGLHESSVRRILYDLARRLAAQREATAKPQS